MAESVCKDVVRVVSEAAAKVIGFDFLKTKRIEASFVTFFLYATRLLKVT